MKLAVQGKNISITDALEDYVTEKVERITKFFDDEHSAAKAEVELIYERNPSIPDNQVAETTLFINGNVLKARGTSSDMYASVDQMVNKLERQVRRYRGRQLDRWQGQTKSNGPELEFEAPTGEEIESKIVRTKQFQMKPMTYEEAALQMELLDHTFFVFTNAQTGDINVVYRRRDGNYGVIEPAR